MYFCAAEAGLLFIVVLYLAPQSMVRTLFCLINLADRISVWAHVADEEGDAIIPEFATVSYINHVLSHKLFGTR